MTVALEGPVVTINISRYRCDALVLTTESPTPRAVSHRRLVPGSSSGGRLDVVALPNLSRSDAEVRTRRFLAALDTVHSSGAGLAERLTAQAELRATVAWLWDRVAAPVLDHLGYSASPPPEQPWPRVWWSPTGALTLLPLHAAGHHEQRGEARPPTVLDRVVSSYTPTLRSLQQSRDRVNVRPRLSPRLLAVAVPETPGWPPLPGTRAETVRLARRVLGAEPLVGPSATRAAVLAALPRCTWAHFACHAISDPSNPSTSHLVLADQPVGVADIMKLDLDHAELAYLSACTTGRGAWALADESIHIGAAFRLAGFDHVVATLWPLEDRTAADAARLFYDRLTNGHLPSAASALHFATRRLREIQPLTPSLWAAHFHIGL